MGEIVQELRETIFAQYQVQDIVLATIRHGNEIRMAGKCLCCWLTGNPQAKHKWVECGKCQISEQDAQEFRKGLVVKDRGIHFRCYLASSPYHQPPVDFGRSCVWADLIRDTVLIAFSQPRYRPLFATLGVTSMEEPRTMAPSLVTMEKERILRIVLVYIHVVICCRIFREREVEVDGELDRESDGEPWEF